jgi:hypothetical protein
MLEFLLAAWEEEEEITPFEFCPRFIRKFPSSFCIHVRLEILSPVWVK